MDGAGEDLCLCGSALVEAEQIELLVPVCGEMCDANEGLGGQAAWLSARENGACDVRCEEGKSNRACNMTLVDLVTGRDVLVAQALLQIFEPRMCACDCFDQRWIRLRGFVFVVLTDDEFLAMLTGLEMIFSRDRCGSRELLLDVFDL